ncbi:MAG: GIY-YIG nuclease family protein [Alphaproteobacteria bacterium]|nr:GIY-YIG nuclease family protein [Alphaproteobacteria bacterium]
MIIYKITNKINRKVYIGQTTCSLRARWWQHCRKKAYCPFIHNAIEKYGRENFTVEQIDVACSRDELDQKEQYWIKFYDSMNPKNGYNLTSGGETRKLLSIAVRKKMSIRMKGEKNPMFGTHHSEEHKRKISEALKGRKKPIGFGLRGSKHPQARKVICIDTGEIFDYIRLAAIAKNLNHRNISSVCNGRRKTCGGYHWRYVDEK